MGMLVHPRCCSFAPASCIRLCVPPGLAFCLLLHTHLFNQLHHTTSVTTCDWGDASPPSYTHTHQCQTPMISQIHWVI